MSSSIRLEKACVFCDSTFIAKTTTTKYCSKACNAKHYKKLKREEKIQATKEKEIVRHIDVSFVELINSKDYLSILEASELLGVSQRTFFRLLKNGTIKSKKLGSRTIIQRSSIDQIFK